MCSMARLIRVPKTYPAYFGAYEEFPKVRAWLDGLENLYLVVEMGCIATTIRTIRC